MNIYSFSFNTKLLQLIFHSSHLLGRSPAYAHTWAGKSRVGKGISAQAAPGTVRESLPSYGSYYPIMLLFQSSNDKTTMDFGLAPVDTFCTTCPYPVSYMCSSSTYGLVHSNNKIRHVLHLC